MEVSRRTLLGALPVAAAAAACTKDAAPAGPPPEVARFSDDWPLPGRDLANSRAVSSAALDRENVGRLEVAWSTPLPGASAFSNVGTTPLVLGGTVLVQDLNSNVRALDRRTGAVRWTRRFDTVQIGPNGVAAGWGKVFAGTGGTRVSAMDLATGKEVWTRTLPRTGSVTVGVQAQVADGLVLVSTVPVDPEKGGYLGGARGVIYALDPADGRTRWTFDTVPEDLWGNPEVNSGGGVWFPPAVDPVRGVAYYGTGNPAPFPGDEQYPNGSSRPGPNLYTDCVLAIRLRDGKLLWYFQATPHDLFDHDLMLTALATGRDGARTVVATGKAGRVIGLDPATGKVRWDTKVGEHQNDELTQLDGPTEVLPGGLGGVNSPPAVAHGNVYVAVVNLPTTYSPDEPQVWPPDLGKRPGAVVAVDVASGDVVWERSLPGDPLGGVLAVNDLLFTSTMEGTLYALDRRDGAVVWSQTAPGGSNTWPSFAGDALFWPVGSGDDPALMAMTVDGAPPARA